ncbi:hypothetical protein ColTof4_05912 [Colletotrichum tofieldiae]|uniref:Protein kinase domain-containing protein n=1 Tax=Colletotrichum tofieldiae TaxID=708197 RepID=A0A166QTW1_9PEZI|nr:hypothetical protein CT0861_06305 [Colletotrichum tofieldiae]GKT53749.1 hypothetical protein ColTof3_01088 [Colletotrichum tofieldiae]GKT73489.1 hypothetical protein ColTof4_05912 [Colletotrichum tofieldiae]
MDPVSAAGLAIGVASIGLQVYTGCVQGIQLLITAKNFPDDCKFLNLRLRMEQQRLFAWSETSGLLDLDGNQQEKILSTNTFVLHRTTVLDLLVQVQCLFREFEEHQRRNERLKPAPDQDTILEHPEKDAAAANFPLPERRKDFIKRAMGKLKSQSREGFLRLSWVSFDKGAFEILLSRFAALNDNMTDILDARMQVEIRDTVQDTNRGVLQLHHRIADLGRLVMALNLKLENTAPANVSSMSKAQREKNADGLELLAKLAKFKAFNESMEPEKQRPWDEATAMSLELGKPAQRDRLVLDREMVTLFDEESEEFGQPRCEATLRTADGSNKRVWIEWKEYDRQKAGDESPPRRVIIDRVGKLAALLNHSPKPEAFRTLHCLGFFDMLGPNSDAPEDDSLNRKLGLVFERPNNNELHPSLPPASLRDLFQIERKPRVTERVKLAHAISSCLLYLHAVNWLHKGLRSHNIVFFRAKSGRVNYAEPYLTGFDYSRPARSDEATDIPQDDAEYNLYRHPQVQLMNPAERERFKKSFDMYSLGVLFVEIAHWTPVDRVLGYDISRRPSLALRVREALLVEDRIAELGANMGEMFEEAARKCIAGGESLGLADGDVETEDNVAAQLSMRFYEDVVKKLDAVRV